VSTWRPGDCQELGEFRRTPGCTSDTWEITPVIGCFAPSCVSGYRLERDGKVLAAVSAEDAGAAAVLEFDEPRSEGGELLIEGCGAPIVLSLPPLKVDTSLEFAASADRLDVEVRGDAAGTFARAASYSLAKGYAVACVAEGTSSALPVSREHSFYQVRAYAYDAPVLVNDERVHAQLFPSVFRDGALSTAADLGPIWDVAVEVAMTSPTYAPCEDYCEACEDVCVDGSTDIASCAAQCAIAGAVAQSCSDEYRAFLGCMTNHPSCEAYRPGETKPSSDDEAAFNRCAVK
jgi:hypothetical protein